MYKFFLTLRYLTRKKIVIFPILVVWLCLMMMIIVTSIMGGFVDRVRQANRDLLGDIVIFSQNPTGWPGYDELAKHLAQQFPEIKASTPVVRAYGLAYFLYPYNQTVPIQLVGIRPAERSQVSRFRETLFRQYIAPHEAADALAPALPADRDKLIAFASENDRNISAKLELLREQYGKLYREQGDKLHDNSARPRQFELAEDRLNRAYQDEASAKRTWQFALSLPEKQYHSKADLLAALLPPKPSFDIPPAATQQAPDAAQDTGCIVGVQIGLLRRDKRGNFERPPDFPNPRLKITVFPVKDTGAISVQSGFTLPFTVVDDSYSGVYDVDSTYIYAPFETVQYMTRMRPDPELLKENPAADFPPRCNELLIKLNDATSANPAATRLLRAKIQALLDESFPMLTVQTWDERQAKYLGAVENEKYMQIFILGLMSLVVLVVIFLIFYMIVRDKTRDIGILKAVGGSELGVLTIFLNYGLFIGIVGGGLGVLCGVAFVTHTNEIHEWIYQTTGIIIWDRSVYLFDRIPDHVSPTVLIAYYAVAILAGLIGALIPATFAACQDPVKAVRYE
ncbi:MAG: hypothetical protein FWD61_01360 [Phycisphaerales bacterium]|nr:hypothetical protein [Phycisphaerales bacterium]